jgi:hypothetical protein
MSSFERRPAALKWTRHCFTPNSYLTGGELFFRDQGLAGSCAAR